MMKKLLYLSVFALYFLAACAPAEPKKAVDVTPNPADSQSQQLAAPTLVFDVEKPTYQLPKDLSIATKVLMPRGGAKDVSKNISDILQADYTAFLKEMCEEDGIKDTETLVKCLVKNFQSLRAEDDVMSWELETIDTLFCNSAQIVSIMRNQYQQVGGAHPLMISKAFNFDATTGKKLANADIFTDLSALLPVVEAKFKLHWAEVLKESKGNYNEAGFDFTDNKFVLPQNIFIGEKEVTFLYNSYEIAPYVMGPTELIISKSDIINLMKLK